MSQSNASNQTRGTYLIYIDESYDKTHFAYSAIFVEILRWNELFADLLNWRREWYKQHGIKLEQELHATDFVAGRSENPQNRDKAYRGALFAEALERIEKMDGIMVMNAITDNVKAQPRLFEWLLNRIQRTLKENNSVGLLICDEGNEKKLTAMVRRMKRHNPIPSQIHYGQSLNLKIDCIIEDPLFKISKSSYFIQIANFIAFALLRNEKPLLGTHKLTQSAFEKLDKVLVRTAYKNDPKKKGIIRAK